MKAMWFGVVALVSMPSTAIAQDSTRASPAPDTLVHVNVGGFVDGYYAYDFDHPSNLDRSFTTQAARHDEFNINLAFLELTLAGARVRGRFAAQFGTSVQANYAGEPRVGTLSGPDVSRFIQEATAGYRVSSSVWVDGGVFFAPFGSENWISRDNWTYTRSLIADNSPYYEAGVKATWQIRPNLTAQLHFINGWQNISETNRDKAIGARVDWSPTSHVTLSYDLFAGNEQPDSVPGRLRQFHEVVVQTDLNSKLSLRGTLDVGMQARPSGGESQWHGYALVARYRASSKTALGFRVEGYHDPDQVIVATGQSFGLHASGGSVNVDVSPATRLLWRSELRVLHDPDALFSHGGGAAPSKEDTVIVTSVALTF